MTGLQARGKAIADSRSNLDFISFSFQLDERVSINPLPTLLKVYAFGEQPGYCKTAFPAYSFSKPGTRFIVDGSTKVIHCCAIIHITKEASTEVFCISIFILSGLSNLYKYKTQQVKSRFTVLSTAILMKVRVIVLSCLHIV